VGIRHAVAAALGRRIVVLGASGFFGSLAADRLDADGLAPVRAARRASGVDMHIDATDARSIRAALRARDIVLDAAGPFQIRNTALVEAAIDVGFDVVDLSDSMAYARSVLALRDRFDRAGVRILTSCSAVSAVSATLVRLSGVAEPTRVSVFLAPASKATANRATIESFLSSVGTPVTGRRAGQLAEARGWATARRIVWPGRGDGHGFLIESADALLLPEVWPSLREVDFWVDTQVPALNALLQISARLPLAVELLRRMAGLGATLARRLGSAAGAFGVEVAAADGAVVRRVLDGPQQSYLIAVAPAVLAIKAVAAGRLEDRGLVRADRQVDSNELIGYLATAGIRLR